MSTPNTVQNKLALLSKLLEMSEGTRTHKEEVLVDGKVEVVETEVKLPPIPRWTLAHHVQARNVDRLARRWAR